jgi:hypothetical protein
MCQYEKFSHDHAMNALKGATGQEGYETRRNHDVGEDSEAGVSH